MFRLGSAFRSPGRRLLAVVCSLVVVGAAVSIVATSRAQIPVEPDLQGLFKITIYHGEIEVGQVYRDVAGPRYTEHWVLYRDYSFDRIREAGPSIKLVAEPNGYKGVSDFLSRVPFPAGSRYVIAQCEEFDRLP